MTKTALVTGFTGQDGTFLTKLLLEKGYKVIGLTRRISTEPPIRVRGKFDFSEAIEKGQLILAEGDLLSRSSLDHIIYQYLPDEVYNLAAQSHVGVSFKQPEFSIEADFMGVVNLIEALISQQATYTALAKEWRMYQASTSEMFGDTKDLTALNENTPLNPNSPYAIAKMAAHQYCKMKRAEGYFISCGILFNHESEIRGGDFVTQKIVRAVVCQGLGHGNVLKLGNTQARRDWGYAGDYVKAMWMMLQHHKADDFVVGTGESHTVQDFVETALSYIEKKVEWVKSKGGDIVHGFVDDKIFVEIDPAFYRPVDVNFLEAYADKANRELKWRPDVGFEELVGIMMKAEIERRQDGS